MTNTVILYISSQYSASMGSVPQSISEKVVSASQYNYN